MMSILVKQSRHQHGLLQKLFLRWAEPVPFHIKIKIWNSSRSGAS